MALVKPSGAVSGKGAHREWLTTQSHLQPSCTPAHAHTHMYTPHAHKLMGTAPSLRYSRWKIKSERQESPGRIPLHPTYNVERVREVRRMEKINQSVAAGQWVSHSTTLHGWGAGALACVCINALILFPIYCLGFRVCDFRHVRFQCTPC